MVTVQSSYFNQVTSIQVEPYNKDDQATRSHSCSSTLQGAWQHWNGCAATQRESCRAVTGRKGKLSPVPAACTPQFLQPLT